MTAKVSVVIVTLSFLSFMLLHFLTLNIVNSVTLQLIVNKFDPIFNNQTTVYGIYGKHKVPEYNCSNLYECETDMCKLFIKPGVDSVALKLNFYPMCGNNMTNYENRLIASGNPSQIKLYETIIGITGFNVGFIIVHIILFILFLMGNCVADNKLKDDDHHLLNNLHINEYNINEIDEDNTENNNVNTYLLRNKLSSRCSCLKMLTLKHVLLTFLVYNIFSVLLIGLLNFVLLNSVNNFQNKLSIGGASDEISGNLLAFSLNCEVVIIISKLMLGGYLIYDIMSDI